MIISGVMDELRSLRDINELCSFADRVTGSDAERRAAEWLGGELRGLGRRVTIEPILVHPQIGLIYALHCGLGVVASLLGQSVPAAGFGLILLVSTAFYLDVNARRYLLRRLLFRRASQNVIAHGTAPEAPLRVIVCANYDAPRTGILASRRLPRGTSQTRLIFTCLIALLPLLGLRMLNLEGNLLNVAQLLPTLALLLLGFLTFEATTSRVSPAANDNATGIAGALELVRRAHGDGSVDLWVLLSGADQAGRAGIREFLSAHRDELKERPTAFVALGPIGSGSPCYETSSGPVVGFPADRRMVELCGLIAETTDPPDGASAFRARHSHSGSAAAVAVSFGHRAVAISCRDASGLIPHSQRPDDLPELIDLGALEGAVNLAGTLIEQLGRDAARATRA